ncbi:MAG: HD domain-containing protein [Desulfuromonadales bacterium]|nr:HD domain-containing protein [Desulfuromonadales bacterium]
MTTDIHTVQDFIRHMLTNTANASLYGMGHQQVTRLVVAAFTAINDVLADVPEVAIIAVDGELIVNGEHQESCLFLNRFSDIMASRGVSLLKLSVGLTLNEVTALVEALASQSSTSAVIASEHVTTGNVGIKTGLIGAGTTADSTSESDLKKIQEMPQHELARFMDIYEAAHARQKLKIAGMSELVTGFIDAFRQDGDAMLAMAALLGSDEYTFTHSTNVCILNIAQATALGIEGQLLHDIGLAAMLHDIGKLYIPEELITKKESLTREEFEIMKQHPTLGARRLLETPGVPRLAVTAAYEHHMKYDLTGYPTVKAGWQLNLCSHMTMISDFFDALRTRRSYREPLGVRQIGGMMLDRIGTDLHPFLTRNFMHIIARLTTVTTPPAPVS